MKKKIQLYDRNCHAVRDESITSSRRNSFIIQHALRVELVYGILNAITKIVSSKQSQLALFEKGRAA
jgi:hypothetical protein